MIKGNVRMNVALRATLIFFGLNVHLFYFNSKIGQNFNFGFILIFYFYTSSFWNETLTYYAKLFADFVAALSSV